MKEQKKGISLIVLVITIIVMLILASAVIITLSNSNIINKAKEAVNKTDVKNFEQELSLSLADMKLKDATYDLDEANAATVQDIKKYIPDFTDKYYGKLIVQNGKLAYVKGNVTEEEKLMFESIGIDAGSYITVAKAEEIKSLAEAVTIDSTIASTDVATYIEDMPSDYADLFTIFQGKLFYRYEKTTYDERVSLHEAGIPYLAGDVNENGTLDEEDAMLVAEFDIYRTGQYKNNLYVIGDVNYDSYVDAADSSAIAGVVQGLDITDYTNIEDQIPEKIDLIGVYNKTIIGSVTGDIVNVTELMNKFPNLTKQEAKKVVIMDGSTLFRYETLSENEIKWMLEYYFPFNLGDANFDGYINDKDLEILKQYNQGKTLTEKQLEILDVDADGEVTLTDQATLKAALMGSTNDYMNMVNNYIDAKLAAM